MWDENPVGIGWDIMVKMVHKRDEGFTIVELVVTTAILLIILLIAFGSFHTLRKEHKRQDELSEANHNAHVALEILSRAIQWAGSGLTNGSITANSIGGDVNGATDTVTLTQGGSDTVTCVGIFEDKKGGLGAAASSGNTTLTLQNATQASNFNTGTKRYISVAGQDTYAITNINSAILTLGSGLKRAYANATPVYRVDKAEYLIVDDIDSNGNKTPVLKKRENNGTLDPIIDYIKDIQIEPLENNTIGSITVVAITKTHNKGTVTLHSIVKIRNK